MSEEKDSAADEGRAGGIQVIARASAIMRALGAQPQGMSLAAIALAVELPRSTVQRIIGALEVEALVEAIRPGSGYRLGPALGQLIHQAHSDIISLARHSLEELCDHLQETVTLSCIRGRQTHVIDRVVAETELRVVIPMGHSLPMHATADGKALLSTLDDPTIAEWIGTTPAQLTPATRDLPALLADMKEVRRSGMAEDQEEHTAGISAISILIPTLMGPHAVSVVAPTSRFKARKGEFREALEVCKAQISSQAGSAPTK
ncbi:IclR family transcriptional regulator [Pseudomonas denitrificans (nom. rej.)]|uniref:IclR family transcriptional regulator n=1 Tax=Pseudomonas denitrificans TaxID=43306 RepID=A0A9X7R424_PSEDE|nr:IclR family transcriptional regulator [Pseudomonas denitrificans (nom. rej.)]QEY72051.1 IclR family transcriptional regulator [Pseudomonas denitrificans (nom. rej.)]